MAKKCAAFLLLLLFVLPILSSAEELWSEEYYRAQDSTGELTDSEQTELDELCLAFMADFRLDLAILASTAERHAGEDPGEVARLYYDDCGFGYGPDRDGIMVLWYRDSGEVTVGLYGAAETAVSPEAVTTVETFIQRFEEEYGPFGPMYAAIKLLRDDLSSPADPEAPPRESESGENTAPESPGEADPLTRLGNGGAALPDWYPEDVEDFQFYSDPDAARVVDRAEIFTADEAGAMRERIDELRQELGRDIVIYTDTSSYGFTHAVFAADFYDFNGYGIGPEREGFCLMICMDPENRGWWCCCTGPETMAQYTEDEANIIDDMLYDYMVEGDYGAGVLNWLENIRRLVLSGSALTPDWALPGAERQERGAVPLVNDQAGSIAADSLPALEALAETLSQSTGADLAIYAVRDPGETAGDYADAYYDWAGFSGDGFLLVLYRTGWGSTRITLHAYGGAAEKYTGRQGERLYDRVNSEMGTWDSSEGCELFLRQAAHLLRTGRVERSRGYWIAMALLCALAGIIAGSTALGRAKRNMEKPCLQAGAGPYLIPHSLKVINAGDRLLHTDTTRTYSPPPKDNDSGSSSGSSSSSGGSSYSSSYSGSSGASHSGSGRSF